MPSRRKPTSTRQKKADQQLRRAIKRGDVPPPDVKKSANARPKLKIGPTGRPISGPSTVQSARKLQSTFVKLPSKFLDETKALASNLPLFRPIPDEKALLQLQIDQIPQDHLSCPKRPKWRYDQSKLEVERNEEGVFRKWLSQTDEVIQEWQSRPPPEGSRMPHSTSHFERNLEVWRQLYVIIHLLAQEIYHLLGIDGVSQKSPKSSLSSLIPVVHSYIFHHHFPPILKTERQFLFSRKSIFQVTFAYKHGSNIFANIIPIRASCKWNLTSRKRVLPIKDAGCMSHTFRRLSEKRSSMPSRKSMQN